MKQQVFRFWRTGTSDTYPRDKENKKDETDIARHYKLERFQVTI